ncbi:hypothetical protein CLV62_101395 [Dysgonomonas alginatilytica]|uniref:Cleaved adhesin domain-containing protein n=1 Tax=Dysgonomonas alginatilytica TaxID=1605892 RepID=A0A2V3PW37_9BACT|nr:hypothetical protein [Dysgonomonas alginatilytica]PXV69126.1 hypothetical protein CLV62_101395 [Dysgonomonas alginatilytica]
MRKKNLLLMGIFSLGLLNAQVGINTKNPLGVLHIDPKGDTNASGTTGASDDIVIKSNGQVGIGTISPAKTLDLRGRFKLVDGTQADGYFLTSDANGNASWKKTMQMKGFVEGVRNFPNLTTVSPVYTGTYISLPAGTWMIAFTCTYRDASVANYIIWRLSTSSGSLVPYQNAQKSTAYSGSAIVGYHTSISCYFLVTNAATQGYYLWAGLAAASSNITYTGEGRLYAIPLS